MTVLEKLTRGRTAYLPLGLVIVGATTTILVLGAGAKRLAENLSADKIFAYAIMTGLLLVIAMLWQWKLYFARKGGNARQIQRDYKRHRWLGILPVALLILHIGKPTGSLLSMMSYLLLLSSFSGLFNNEIVRQRVRWARKLWLLVHVGSAALIVPLVVLHIWAALAFKGP
jgi:hypothetical protein